MASPPPRRASGSSSMGPAGPTMIALDGRGAEPGADVLVAGEEITNEDEPVKAIRARPGASVVLAAADAAAGRSDALVSAGATGATMAAATFALRRLHGVRRPALALQLLVPGRAGPPTLLLDVGANSEVRPGDLVQFAFLGSAFSRAVLGIERPRVALLSVGEEAGKGSSEVIEAHAELRRLTARGAGEHDGRLNFVGNVEGRDLLAGVAEVIVTDGFTGNVTLKTIEGTARAIADAVAAAARSGPLAMAGGFLLRPALGGLRERMDPDTTGGAGVGRLGGVAGVFPPG